MTPFRFWLSSVVIVAAAFYLLPDVRHLIWFLFIPYLVVFVWGIVDLRSQFFVKAFIRNKYETAGVCLTFDDGPDPELTNDVCGLLSRYGMKATFFVVGEKAREYSSIVKQACDLGHTIACHDLSHSAFSNFRFSSTMVNDITSARKIIQNIIGENPLLYRPPVGLANPHLDAALARLSMHCVGWSVRARDSGNRRPDRIRRIGGLRVKAGDVILLHDCLPKPGYKKEYLDQLGKLLETIKAKGLTTLGVDEMFGVAAYEGAKIPL